MKKRKWKAIVTLSDGQKLKVDGSLEHPGDHREASLSLERQSLERELYRDFKAKNVDFKWVD